jgi:hypothetical protein
MRVLDRDGRCIALVLDPEAGFCKDQWGNVISPFAINKMTLDHIQEGYGRMGVRAPSRMDTLITVCPFHHLHGWATSHRPLLREYLDRV